MVIKNYHAELLRFSTAVSTVFLQLIFFFVSYRIMVFSLVKGIKKLPLIIASGN